MATPETSEVVADVAALAAVAETAASTEAVIDAVIENANERVATAEAAARQIAEGAMETERARELQDLKEEFRTWQNNLAELRSELTGLSSRVQTVEGQVSAVATLAVAPLSPAPTTEDLSLLTPPVSETMREAVQEVQEIIPASVSESVVVESPVPAKPKAARRWI